MRYDGTVPPILSTFFLINDFYERIQWLTDIKGLTNVVIYRKVYLFFIRKPPAKRTELVTFYIKDGPLVIQTDVYQLRIALREIDFIINARNDTITLSIL